ncbi:YbaN family protein [bacterium]|nr:YbaN family protein [bacterium]
MTVSKPYVTPWLRIVLLIAGFVSLVLGIIALLVPIVPTTPFLLVAAACFFRSSQKFYDRLLSSPYFGPKIRDYREGRGIPLRTRLTMIFVFWIALGTSTCLFVKSHQIQLVLLAAALLVAFLILRIRGDAEGNSLE